jgi:cyclopropane fatty-acyl-phospholipid synthase-like methyltransferase
MIGKIKKRIAKHPKLFNIFKKILSLRPIYSVYRIFFPSTERYDPSLAASEEHYFNTYSKLILDMIPGGRILDIGCGYGYLSNLIADKKDVSRVVAIDKINPNKFRFITHPKINYLQRDITNLSEILEPFDVITSTEFIEHIKEGDFIKLLSWIRKQLKPGGIFIGSTPLNRTDLDKFSNSPFHLREYQPKSFEKILIDSGYKNIEIREFDEFFTWKARI